MTSFDAFATEKSIIQTSYQFATYYVPLQNIIDLICFASYKSIQFQNFLFFLIIIQQLLDRTRIGGLTLRIFCV